MFKVTYLFHSGFTIETDTDYIVIDYFRDNCIKQKMRDCGQLSEECMPKDKKILFFRNYISISIIIIKFL